MVVSVVKGLFRIKNVSVSKDIEKAKTNFMATLDNPEATREDVDKTFYRLLYHVNVSNMRYNKVALWIASLSLTFSVAFFVLFLYLNINKFI